MDHDRVNRNDPCPCGSGKKYKQCCRLKELSAEPPAPITTITDRRGRTKKRSDYPLGTVALYGPDDNEDHQNRRRSVLVAVRRSNPQAMGRLGRHDQPKDPEPDPGILQRARGQVGRDERSKYGLSARRG
jgi:hypothetical protein